MGFDFAVVVPYLGSLFQGAVWTVIVTCAGGALSLAGGVVFAVAALYAPWPVRWGIKGFLWLFRGTPLLLQLFLIYFGLVEIGIDLDAFAAGILGLGLHYATYNADVIQAGILAVDRGQMEAGRTLGLSQGQTLRKIIVPQALRDMAPPLGNNMIALLKDSALVSVIGVAELTLSAQLAISQTFRPFEFYATAGVFYYVINLGLEAILGRIERRTQVAR
ncbi:polar amino acid transport system permease protein [Angulomicrobium tetraedrale]|uniref:Glutamate/aspartate import permease protein GltK n=1 Tax=Ancylobacter tetraedralis TaxID=217068 RepID=A0A839ZB50_9HYPH|nr:polar amino acid transport system permease protein [Ancylobacter tetraedralis]